jgi:hypothetical protein
MPDSPSRRAPTEPRLRVERLEDRVTPAFYAVPDSAQLLSSIGIPDHTYVPPSGAGPVYYVAPTATGGPSTNPNAPGSARLTLNSSLPNGSTVVFADGEYRDVPNNNRFGTSVSADGLTLMAAPGAKPWILGSKVATGWSPVQTVSINGVSTPLSFATRTANPWLRTFDAETDYPPYFNDAEEVDAARPTSRLLDMVFVDRRSLKQVQDNPTTAAREGPEWFGPGTFWVGDVGGELRVYVGADPAGKTVEVSAYGRGLSNFGGAPDLTVRGLGFAHFAFIPVDHRSARTTVESSTFAWNGYTGLYMDGQISGSSAADAVVRNSRFVGNGSDGVLGLVTDRMVFEGNRVAFNNAEGFRTAWAAAGAKFGRASDMVIRGNTFENNFATGLWVDINMFRTQIVDNLVRDNTNQGVFVEISHDNVVAFNLIVRNGTGLLIAGASKTRVYNNTLADNGIAVNVKEDSRTQYTGAAAAAGSTYDTYDNVLVNNIFAGVTGTRNLIADFGSTTNDQPTIQVVRNGQTLTVGQRSAEFVSALDGNVYFDPSSPAPATVRWDPTTANGGQVSYPTLAAFRAALPAYEANGRMADPRFVGAGATEWERFALRADSPLVGVGAAIPADILAAVGRSAGAPPLTGAIDAVSPPPPPPPPAAGLQGGGFEAPDLAAGAFQYAPTGTPWAFSASAGVAANGSGFTASNPGAPDGDQVAFLQNTGTASQTVSLAAGTYQVRFRAAQRGNFNEGSQSVRVVVGGTVLGTFTPAGAAYETFTTTAFTLSAAGSREVRLEGVGGAGDRTAFVDLIEIVTATSPPVTVPLANAGFEAPDLAAGGFQYNPGGTGWAFSASSGVAANGSGFTAGNPAAPQGDQVAFLQNAGSLTQAVSVAAGSYAVSFRAAQRGNFNPGGNQTVRVMVDGAVVGTLTPSGTGYEFYETAAFALAAGTRTLRLEGLGSGDSTAFVDDILLTLVG